MNTPTKPVEQKARELTDKAVNEIMDAFGRAGGLQTILESANYASRIRSMIWLRINAALNTDEER